MESPTLYVDQLDQATREWQEELPADLTDTELTWQPFENGHSIAALLVHIAEVEQFWLHHLAAGEPYEDLEGAHLGGEIDQYGVRWATPPVGRPLAYYTALLATTRARTKALVAGLDPALVVRRQDRELTLHWLLTHVILHEAYHGGQAVLLLLQQRTQKGQRP